MLIMPGAGAMKSAIHTPAERVVSVTCEGHQWLFRFPEGSLGKEPTIAEAEYRGSEKPHDPKLEKQARNEAIKEAVKQGWTKPT
jgi:hypothetical protein